MTEPSLIYFFEDEQVSLEKYIEIFKFQDLAYGSVITQTSYSVIKHQFSIGVLDFAKIYPDAVVKGEGHDIKPTIS